MRVWVHSNYRIYADALVLLLRSVGCEVDATGEEAEVALWDLSTSSPPFPVPPALPTLAITSGAEADVISLLRQRYRGCIHASDSAAVLKKALEAVRRGEIWADRELLTRTLDSFAAPHLTDKEQEVFRLLSQGLSNRAIAARLGVVEGTVKMHVSHLFAKLGTRSRAELIAHLRVESRTGTLTALAERSSDLS